MPRRYLAGILLLIGARVYAQSTKAEMLGTVRDPSGLPVMRAAVTLLNSGTGAKLETESDDAGIYHFFALSAGSYEISIVRTGFSTLRRDGITVRVGEQVSLDLQLQVGDV